MFNWFDYYDAHLASGRDRDRRKVANNTYAVRMTDDVIGVQLHATIIVECHRDGSLRLNAGSWQTVTTKARMNDHTLPLGVRVWSERYQWKVGHPARRDDVVDFYNGVSIDAAGVVA